MSLDRNVLVSSNTFDDAGVYRLDRHRALVQTVDFFTPIVDDPFSYGQIAAANSLSDVFAMGGRPLTALNVVGFPADLVSPKTVSAILRGGLAKAAELGLVRAATDVTGYGLMGHLVSLCRASGVSADVDLNAVPMIGNEIADLIELGSIPEGTRQNLYATTVVVDWGNTDETRRILLTDAQTSGGLLLCVAEARLEKVQKILEKARTPRAAVIGRIVPRRRRRPLICITR